MADPIPRDRKYQLRRLLEGDDEGVSADPGAKTVPDYNPYVPPRGGWDRLKDYLKQAKSKGG